MALCLVFLLESALWVVLGVSAPAHAQGARAVQIVPSLLGATAVSALFWVLVTFLLGRVYCSSVCPLGTLQDCVLRVRRAVRLGAEKRGKRSPFKALRYKPAGRTHWVVLGVYIVCMAAGIGCVPLLLEPWPAFVNVASHVGGGGMHESLVYLGVGSLVGLGCSVLAGVFVLVYALLYGRDFCNDVCPVGTALRVVAPYAVFHIELDPDRCVSCLKCEDVCKAGCISIATRTVDNGRCIRCFNCVAACPEPGALRFTSDRTGVMTGLGAKS